MRQKPNESVLEFSNRIKKLVMRIMQLKQLESGVSESHLTFFNEKLEKDAAYCFKDGLKFNISIQIGDVTTLKELILKALKIERKLERQSEINREGNNFTNITKIKKVQPSKCQICRLQA